MPADQLTCMLLCALLLEEWKQIPSWPKGYEASSTGRIRSNTGRAYATGRSLPGRVLRQSRQRGASYAHLKVSTKHKGGLLRGTVSRLVLEAFVGPCPPSQECRHIDGNVFNNSVANLAWGTHAQNENDKKAHGTYYNRFRRINVVQVRHIKDLIATGDVSFAGIAELYGVDHDTIRLIARGINWGRVSGSQATTRVIGAASS